MKKQLLSFVAFIAIVSVASAQTPEIRYGAKGGINFASLSNVEYSKGYTGFHIGGVVEIKLSDKFSVQPELLFSKQGVKIEGDISYSLFNPNDFNVSMKGKDVLNYINIPVMAKYYVRDGFSLQVGPQVGYLLSTKSIIDHISVNGMTQQEMEAAGIELEYDSNSKNHANKIDFGLNFGLGYELSNGLFFDARYNLGITNVDKKYYDENFKREIHTKMKNNVFQLSVGYKF
ncbi:MAG: PorT family protein [Flavobacteriaceae bacterium]|jgi:opacity protein-like surface antigen|nr:PorT family protein [Flavobacteriaceae bacterium]